VHPAHLILNLRLQKGLLIIFAWRCGEAEMNSCRRTRCCKAIVACLRAEARYCRITAAQCPSDVILEVQYRCSCHGTRSWGLIAVEKVVLRQVSAVVDIWKQRRCTLDRQSLRNNPAWQCCWQQGTHFLALRLEIWSTRSNLWLTGQWLLVSDARCC
jgi:hypothetical protein